MIETMRPAWETMRTAETREIEDGLRLHFEQVDAYRYNSASVRIRVIDPCFDGLDDGERRDLVRGHLKALPRRGWVDMLLAFPMTPAELDPEPTLTSAYLRNLEFDNPTPSEL